jgi:preprotein translocase subunit YajC
MPKICNLTKGATVTTHSGKTGLFERLEGDRIVVRVPDGLRRIPLTAIARWDVPPEQVRELAKAPVKALAVGDRVLITSINARGNVAQLDDQYQEARVNDIEGYVHPQTGFEVISQWFPYACLKMIAL